MMTHRIYHTLFFTFIGSIFCISPIQPIEQQQQNKSAVSNYEDPDAVKVIASIFTCLRWYATLKAIVELPQHIQTKNPHGMVSGGTLILASLLEAKKYIETNYNLTIPGSSIVDSVGNSILGSYALYSGIMLGVSVLKGSWNIAQHIFIN